MKNSGKIILPLVIITLITVLGCYYILKEYQKQQSGIGQNVETAAPEQIVSEDELQYETVGILVGKNEEKSLLTFQSIDTGKQVSYNYDGTTLFLGKHGNSMSLDQFELGEIVLINYSVHSGIIDSVRMTDNTWTQSGVTKFEIDQKARTMTIGKTLYKLNRDVVISYGQELANIIDITNVDTITVKGREKEVYSIIVDCGHGYLRLTNDAYFIGGWIEVGQEIIKPISEAMLIPVPEGDYRIRVTNKGYAGDVDVKIERDKESKLDLSEIDLKEVAVGHVKFEISPDYAQLYVDDVMTDFEDRVPLEYGIHKVRVECVNHETVNTVIKVTSEYADLKISLDRIEEDSSSSSSTGSSGSSTSSSSFNTNFGLTAGTSFNTVNASNLTSSSTVVVAPATISSSSSSMPSTTVTTIVYMSSSTISSSSSSSSTSSSSSSFDPLNPLASLSSLMQELLAIDDSMMYIEAPVGANVYIDGVYVGVAPTGCLKKTGTHIVTLSAEGYETRSYTIEVEDDDNDLTLSFSDLIGE